MAKNDTLLVTGGAGFIGANFVRLALAESAGRVVVLDKLTYAGNLESLADVADSERFHFVRGDIADRQTVESVFAEHKPTAVANFAAETHVDRSIDSPEVFVEANTVGTFRLLEASRAHCARLSKAERAGFRFLHVSTDEVYGSLGATGAFTEETPYAPSSPYSASKAAADHFVRAYHETYGLPVLITNCANNFGPFQFPEKLIPLMILNAVEGKPLPIYGDGGQVRDWIYVEDHCRGIWRVLQAGRIGEKYNIGSGCERTNMQVVDGICDELERQLPAARNPALASQGVDSYAELKEQVADRPGHDRRYAIDATKARAELGWSPSHDLESGLAQTVRWYLDHRDWCEHVQAGTSGRQRLGLGS